MSSITNDKINRGFYMESFEKQMYERALRQNDVYAKALANFMFREIIEDAHAKYNISQEDIEDMCKNAVDRAALFLSIQESDLYRPFAVYALPGLEWDKADIDTDFAKDFILKLHAIGENI